MKTRPKIKKKLLVLVLVMTTFLTVMLSGCNDTEASRASYSLSQEADNFNINRQVTVINCIQGDTIFQMTGRMSINKDHSDNQLEVTVETAKGVYEKKIIGLSDNVTYLVDDLGPTQVDQYSYTLNYNPKMWLPVKFKNVD